jgi:NAD(P)-dependent dehydrogenase (short-subunit alcohol dehydrogenase family)
MAGCLNGKIALITGGGSGIGQATALAFAREGAKVVVADVVVEGSEETVKRIKSGGGEAVFVKTNVAEESEVEAVVKHAVATYGRLDCAFNNAGIAGPVAKTADHKKSQWDRVIAINLTGVWLCMKYEIEQMLAQGGGTIVNTASVAGLVGFRYGPAYVAAKHGVVGLTKTAALEYAKANIRVNAVCPGVIRTPMFERGMQVDPRIEETMSTREPIGRLGTPEEIAEAVVWLSSDAASFVTGLPMAVDGGWVAQ